MTENEEYLWSGAGQVDSDVARLEQLMSPMRWDGTRVGEDPATAHESARRVRTAWWPVVAILAAACALLLFLLNREEGEVGTRRLMHGARALDPGSLFVAEDEGQSVLRLGELGTLRLERGSRLWVERLRDEEVLLRLERGALSALVSADARPGLFNVDTPATRCVDLGCAYDLSVEPNGDTRVEVTLGRVAFRNGEAEAFVPAGAVCRASRARGAGTPYFPESSVDVRAKLSAFDAEEQLEARRALAQELCALASTRLDALPLWHLLQDADDVVHGAAARRLAALAGTPSGLDLTPGKRLDAAQRGEWREYLWPDPYR